MALDSLGRIPHNKGVLGYFNLVDWWLSTFSGDERSYIERVYAPMAGAQSLTRGSVIATGRSSAGILSDLASWFRKPQDFSIACRLLSKAEELAIAGDHIVDLHFVYLGMIEVFYKMRDSDDSALGKAIEACNRQIRLAQQAARGFKRLYPDSGLPSHTGYKQLSIILEKQGDYAGAISLCQKAKKQGWNEDWDKRIARCQAKIEKNLKKTTQN